MSDEEAWTFELRKFYSAKRIWHERNKQAGPITLRSGAEWKGTNAEWFELHYGESLEAFAARAKREGLRARVEEWERERKIGDAGRIGSRAREGTAEGV
jgi:hypothetical protein